MDEGQDTSKVQLEIIRTIAYPKNNLFIVADDDQSYMALECLPRPCEFNKTYKDGKNFSWKETRSSKYCGSM